MDCHNIMAVHFIYFARTSGLCLAHEFEKPDK